MTAQTSLPLSPRDLVTLALGGLSKMWRPDRGTLVTRVFDGARETESEHLSARYCVMSSVGLHRAREAGYAVALDPVQVLRRGLELEPPTNLDQLGMGLWADAELGADLAPALLGPLVERVRDVGGRGRAIGRPLAWALTALSLHHARTGDRLARTAADELARFALERCHRPATALFTQIADDRPIWPAQALFSTQIYWVYALATYGRVAGDTRCLEVAAATMRRLVALRDPLGGWAWRYDPATGGVPDPFPVYSVHQHGMAPMTLHLLVELGLVAPESAAVTLHESLAWLWHNQLGASMVDVERQTIHRSVRRRFPMNRIVYTAGRWGLARPITRVPAFLRLNPTCRPYELGWLAYAWAGREDTLTLDRDAARR